MNCMIEVEKQVRLLMLHHGVGSVGFRFSKGTRQIACVAFERHRSATGPVNLAKELRLSKRWAMVLPDSDLWEVIIHEIAHIKTLNSGERHHHGPAFKRVVRELGGMATETCFKTSVYIDGSPRA